MVDRRSFLTLASASALVGVVPISNEKEITITLTGETAEMWKKYKRILIFGGTYWEAPQDKEYNHDYL